jgi:hypothetical protein
MNDREINIETHGEHSPGVVMGTINLPKMSFISIMIQDESIGRNWILLSS